MTPSRMLLPLLLLLAVAATAHAADVSGSQDHALVARYQDSEIVTYASKAFTDYALLVAPATAYGGIAKNATATRVLEGKLTRIHYRAPAGRATLEVFRNYQQALDAAGFEVVFDCARAECGGRNFNHAVTTDMTFREYWQDQHYLAAKLGRAEGDVYVALYAVMNKAGGGADAGRVMVQLHVLELAPMQQRMVVLDSSQMRHDLDAHGRVALYGIAFDFDQATMRADAAPQLEQIGRLLKAAPALRVLVVGHTDGKGDRDYNATLSQRRAQSIVAALVSEHGIARARLTAVGVGMAAPVASNRTEAGRALNRRVELVELGD